MAALDTKLKARLDKAGVPTLEMAMDNSIGAEASEVKSILNAQIQRLVLRLCSTSLLSSTLCLDLTTCARLFEKGTQKYVYDRMFVYSDADPSSLELQPYELSVTSSTTAATGRALEAYCEEGGGEILQADLSNALDATVNRVIQDLGLRLE